MNIIASPLEINEAIISEINSRRETLYSQGSSTTPVSFISETANQLRSESSSYRERFSDINCTNENELTDLEVNSKDNKLARKLYYNEDPDKMKQVDDPTIQDHSKILEDLDQEKSRN